MLLMTLKIIRTGRMNKRERQKYFEDMNKRFSCLSEEDKRKLQFAKNFLKELQFFKPEDGSRINVGPMDVKTLEYFIFSVLLEFESQSANQNDRSDGPV